MGRVRASALRGGGPGDDGDEGWCGGSVGNHDGYTPEPSGTMDRMEQSTELVAHGH